MPRDLFYELVQLLAKPYAEESARYLKRHPYKMSCKSCGRRIRDQHNNIIVYKQTISPPLKPFRIVMQNSTITNDLTNCPECNNPFQNT